MKACWASDANDRRAPRTPRVTVPDPRVSLVESPESSDPAALLFALELLARWALRARHARTRGAPTSDGCATCATEK